ncbi:MAG: ParB/Srx family N-terminal domain-containing protein, partial [Nitrosospira sp.]
MNISPQRPWPATAVELIAIETLLPYAKNARTHSHAQVEKIAALMRRFGVTVPILRDEAGIIIAGHARLSAATLNRDQGDSRFAQLPVMTAVGWTEDEKRAYVIADNQSALLAGWDFGLLADEVGTLSEAGFDLGLIGFGEADLRRLTGYAAGLADPDAVSNPDGPPVACVGDLWLLGRHRVLCGSATEASDVNALLTGERPSLMATDPPYGVVYDPSWRNAAGVSASARTGKVQNDDR